ENGTDKKVSEFIKIVEDEAGITVLRNGNLGWVKGVNAGVGKSFSPYLLILNDDHVLSPATLNKMYLRLTEEANSISVVGVETAKLDPVHALGMVTDSQEWDFLAGSGLLIKRSVWDEIGGFDEEFKFGYGEDLDFCCRVKAVGGVLHHIPHTEEDCRFTDHKRLRETDDFDLMECINKNRRVIRGRWWRKGRLDHTVPDGVVRPHADGSMRVAPRHFLPSQDGVGKGMHTHGHKILVELEKQGVILDDNAPVALSYVPCASFARDRWNKREEWLFTMVEHDQMAKNQIEAIQEVDRLVTCSNHSVKVFRDHGHEGPIDYVPLGIDTDVFQYREPGWAGIMPFRFLWVGAPSMRKGWDLVLGAFYSMFGPLRKEVELYLKTTFEDSDYGEQVEQIDENVTLDTRNLSSTELCKLYQSAHIFVLPSRGEGFGQTALEAMACGCLVIAPKYTGLGEFINNDTALVVEGTTTEAYSGTFPIISDSPEIPDFMNKMAESYRRFHKYREVIENGSKLARTFTWERTASELISKMFSEELQHVAE
ncbi:MAG TPA: hypothetical protein DHN29_22850, partial [Cytophagales bacterium]|nr:hypothetical protein [Cytophagales bacterium]